MVEVARPTDSVRDPEQWCDRLLGWLTSVLPADAAPAIESVHPPSGNGMSSETILLDASWADRAGATAERRAHPLVVRVAPLETAMPVFPVYDMNAQFETMRAVAETTAVPVPVAYWCESDPAILGAPFLVMSRVEGLVPPDVMPYNFGSWVSEASAADRDLLTAETVKVLAALHEAPTSAFPALGEPAGLRAHLDGQRAYYEWVAGAGRRSPLIERCLDALEEAMPASAGPPVLSWGDARIGNIIYRDFRPVAVLDWEMAGFGPRELDLGWLIYLHRFFEDIARAAGLPGLPDFLRRDDVAARYEQASGVAARDLDYYTLYAALRQAIVMFRVQSRAIHFGQAEAPADPDDMIMHRATLEAMLAGTYRDGVA